MYVQIDHNSALPLHAQVEQLLRELINEPEYKAGKFLPNEVDLAKRLGSGMLLISSCRKA